MKPIDWHGIWVPEMHPLESVRAAFLEPNGRVTFLFREASQ